MYNLELEFPMSNMQHTANTTMTPKTTINKWPWITIIQRSTSTGSYSLFKLPAGLSCGLGLRTLYCSGTTLLVLLSVKRTRFQQYTPPPLLMGDSWHPTTSLPSPGWEVGCRTEPATSWAVLFKRRRFGNDWALLRPEARKAGPMEPVECQFLHELPARQTELQQGTHPLCLSRLAWHIPVSPSTAASSGRSWSLSIGPSQATSKHSLKSLSGWIILLGEVWFEDPYADSDCRVRTLPFCQQTMAGDQ